MPEPRGRWTGRTKETGGRTKDPEGRRVLSSWCDRTRGGAGHLGHGAGSGLGQPQDCLRTTSGLSQDIFRTTIGQPQDNLRATSGQPQGSLRATSTRYPSACSNPNRAWGACANTDVVDNSNVLSKPGPDNPRIVS